MLAMTLTTGDLAGTAVGEREKKGRATEAAAAVSAAGGNNRAGERAPSRLCPGDGHRGVSDAGGEAASAQSTWRSIGDIASAILDRVKQSPQPGNEGGVSARLRRCTHRR